MWKPKTESFSFNEFIFKWKDNIPDKIKNIILPTDEIANEIEKIPVPSDLEEQLMTDDKWEVKKNYSNNR